MSLISNILKYPVLVAENISNVIKIGTICKDLDLDHKTAVTIMDIHYMTKKGKTGIDFFILKENESVKQKIESAGLGYLYNNDRQYKEELNNIEMLFENCLYRHSVYNFYEKMILPQIHEYSLPKIIKNSFKRLIESAATSPQ